MSRRIVCNHAFHAYPNQKLGRAIRTQRYRFVEWKKQGEPPESAELELYGYEKDSRETKNFAADRPEVVKEMRTILAKYPEAVARKP